MMQMFLRRNHTDSFGGEKSFLYGRSTANQRIEGWWATLRKQSAQFWINLFQTFQDDGHFTGDFLDKSLIQFCFLNFVQVKIFNCFLKWVMIMVLRVYRQYSSPIFRYASSPISLHVLMSG